VSESANRKRPTDCQNRFKDSKSLFAIIIVKMGNIKEACRYLHNAKEILSIKAEKQDGI